MPLPVAEYIPGNVLPPLDPGIVSVQPENLPPSMFNEALVLSRTDWKTGTEQLRGLITGRETPEGGWPLDVRGMPGTPSGSVWYMGKPILPPRIGVGYTPAELQAARDARWYEADNPFVDWVDPTKSSIPGDWPHPSEYYGMVDQYYWPKDLLPSTYLKVLQRRQVSDPEWAQALQQYRLAQRQEHKQDIFGELLSGISGMLGSIPVVGGIAQYAGEIYSAVKERDIWGGIDIAQRLGVPYLGEGMAFLRGVYGEANALWGQAQAAGEDIYNMGVEKLYNWSQSVQGLLSKPQSFLW